jgi:hypothetical protein
MAVLVGLLLGSLWRIWPYQKVTEVIVRDKPRVIGAEPFVPASLEPMHLVGLLGGLAFVVAIEWYAIKRKQAALAAQADEDGKRRP